MSSRIHQTPIKSSRIHHVFTDPSGIKSSPSSPIPIHNSSSRTREPLHSPTPSSRARVPCAAAAAPLAHAVAGFTGYFGLRPPCLLCFRVDRLFGAEDGHQAAGDARWLRELLCGVDLRDECSSSWKKDMMKDAERKGALVCSCCESLIHIFFFTRAGGTHTKREEDPAVQGKTVKEEEDHAMFCWIKKTRKRKKTRRHRCTITSSKAKRKSKNSKGRLRWLPWRTQSVGRCKGAWAAAAAA